MICDVGINCRVFVADSQSAQIHKLLIRELFAQCDDVVPAPYMVEWQHHVMAYKKIYVIYDLPIHSHRIKLCKGFDCRYIVMPVKMPIAILVEQLDWNRIFLVIKRTIANNCSVFLLRERLLFRLSNPRILCSACRKNTE